MADMSVTSQSASPPGLGYNKFRAGIGDPDISIEIGQIVVDGGGEFGGAIYALADGSDLALANVSGIAASAGERGGFRGGHVDIQFTGLLTLPTAVWDARHGFTGGLEPGEVYYLSSTVAGRMQGGSPTTPGEVATPIGFAVNATTLQIQIGTAVLVPSP